MKPELANALLIDKNFHPAVCVHFGTPWEVEFSRYGNYPGGNEFSKGNNVPYVYLVNICIYPELSITGLCPFTLPLNLVNEEKFLGQIHTQDNQADADLSLRFNKFYEHSRMPHFPFTMINTFIGSLGSGLSEMHLDSVKLPRKRTHHAWSHKMTTQTNVQSKKKQKPTYGPPHTH